MRVLNRKYWPHRVVVAVSSGTDPIKWCQEHLPGKHRWRLAGPDIWYFADGKDALMFRLRWA
jgi:hypothetical protein